MFITVVCASLYMWRKRIEHFPFGLREVRSLLVARGLSGFFGVFGMYCKYLDVVMGTVTFAKASLPACLSSVARKSPQTAMLLVVSC
jgi:hypothetical protein